jgi:hypothetical protein
LQFLCGGGQGGLDRGDLAEPALLLCLLEPVAQVGVDLFQPLLLGWVDPEEGASDTGLTEMILSWDWSLPLRLTSLTVIRDLYGTWQPGVSPHGSGWPGRGDE